MLMKLFITACAALAALGVAWGEGELPEESCETPDWHVADDENSLCNIGSACRTEFRRVNGSEEAMWPDLDKSMRHKRLHAERHRLQLNEYQPAIVHKYTELGYKKDKLPAETYDFLMKWYSRSSGRKVAEKWPPDNTYVNHWEFGTSLVQAPGSVQQRLYKDLSPLMEEWAGTKLKSTSCYGVRLYYKGSVLANHVDRVDTHVISAIINVAQEDVETGWPLYVRGHDGIARNIFIEPGEIIFYESASVIHGRPETFVGGSFANIFVHYAPVEGWTVTADNVREAIRMGDRKKTGEARRAAMKKMEEQ